MNQMWPITEINTILMFHGMDYVNLICLDSAEAMHIATYTKSTNKWVDFNTQKPIDEPVLFCEIPRHNEHMFEAIVYKMYNN